MDKSAIVVGAGIGGIATSIRLACKGYKVSVFETARQAGGKLNETHHNGFRFDMGPSLFTLPNLVTELFELCDERPEQYFQYTSLDIICRYFYTDGSSINAYQDVEKFANEIQQVTGEKKSGVLQFLSRSRELYELTAPVFIFKSFHKVSTFLSKAFFKALLHIYKLDTFRTMHNANASWFSDSRVVQLFDRYATYNGSNPYKAPATLNVIPHLEHSVGAYYPTGGMYRIAQSLLLLAERQGVTFHFQTPVTRILTSHHKIVGVEVSDRRYKADVVVSDVDIVSAYKLLGKQIPQRYIKHERSSSALIFYWGIDKAFPELELHNILFSGNYPEEFRCLFNTKTVYSDPTVYLYISKKKEENDAPVGCENWFVMINVPENIGQDWDSIVAVSRKQIIQKINTLLATDIAQHIVFEKMLDPRSIESGTSSFHGSLYGNSSNGRFAAFSRHPNFKRSIKGLYFAGGSVHPGGGIPLCLASAKIIDELIGK